MLADMGYDISKNHVLKITNGTAGTAIWDKTTTYALASPLTEGTKYTVTAKICAADVTKGTTMKFVLTGGSAKYGDEKAILANTFHVVSETFTAGNDNVGIEVDFGYANGTVYLDDVSCVAEGSSINLVSNGDFEEPLSTAGWTIPSWTGQTMTHAEQDLGEVTAFPAQKVTIGSTGYATMVASNPLSVPVDVTAYFAKYDSTKGNVKQTAETTLPLWGRAVINGEPGDYYFAGIDAGDVTANWDDSGLEVSWGNVVGDGSTILALGKKSGVVGFVRVANGVTIPSGKAYLVISAPAHDFIGFGEETTAIEPVQQNAKADNQFFNLAGQRVTGVNVVKGQMEDERSEYFNLAGQRVAQPTKGLYIVNGKKVLVK